ncbi:MAG: hypothetical protein ACJ75G_08175 [Gaiellaceae bacterium]
MHVLPSSPRLRRRLAWIGIAVTLAGAIAAIVVLVPSPKAPSSAPPKNAPPAQFATHSTRVSRAERRQIDATLDRFLRAGLDGSSPATAWHLAGPELKVGSTLRKWRAGTSPLPYFPTSQKAFHDWTPVDVGPHYVVFDHLLVHPRKGSRTTARIFSGEVVKRGSRWLVNRFYTIAVMQRPTKAGTHQVGPNDYAAPGASAPSQTSGAALGKQWLLVVGGLVGLALLFPLGFAIASAVRSRRRRKQYEQGRDRDLPPLPRSAQMPASGARRP